MSKPRISFLSQDELKAIHNASLQVLEKTGIKVMSKKALDVLQEAGAKVDYEKKRATIPADVVEEAVKRAPKTIKYCARNPKYDLMLDKKGVHFTTDGYAPFIRDFETGERRSSTKADLADWIRIADYLDNVHLVWASVCPGDVPAPMQKIVETITALSNTEKHFQGEALSAREAQYEIEIAAAIVGGREELRKRPIISAVQCPIAPLVFEEGSIEAVIEFARAGIPVAPLPMPLMCETGPATVAGTVVVCNVENLASLVISEFASPGAPVVYSCAAGGIDIKTGSAAEGAPEYGIVQMAAAEMARFYNLPSLVCGGCSDSKLPDVQAGFERAMTLTTSILTGADVITGLGGLNTASTMSPELLVIDNEIIDAIFRVARGFEVNDDTLAVDVIDKVGPGGHFLGQRHTLEHFKKETWVPKISDRRDFTSWQQAGSRSLDEVAKEKVREILATHKPAPLPEDIEREISQILKRAEAELL
jgi:trimethylamine--corrinoid protein Co-methyltransferase